MGEKISEQQTILQRLSTLTSQVYLAQSSQKQMQEPSSLLQKWNMFFSSKEIQDHLKLSFLNEENQIWQQMLINQLRKQYQYDHLKILILQGLQVLYQNSSPQRFQIPLNIKSQDENQWVFQRVKQPKTPQKKLFKNERFLDQFSQIQKQYFLEHLNSSYKNFFRMMRKYCIVESHQEDQEFKEKVKGKSKSIFTLECIAKTLLQAKKDEKIRLQFFVNIQSIVRLFHDYDFLSEEKKKKTIHQVIQFISKVIKNECGLLIKGDIQKNIELIAYIQRIVRLSIQLKQLEMKKLFVENFQIKHWNVVIQDPIQLWMNFLAIFHANPGSLTLSFKEYPNKKFIRIFKYQLDKWNVEYEKLQDQYINQQNFVIRKANKLFSVKMDEKQEKNKKQLIKIIKNGTLGDKVFNDMKQKIKEITGTLDCFFKYDREIKMDEILNNGKEKIAKILKQFEIEEIEDCLKKKSQQFIIKQMRLQHIVSLVHHLERCTSIYS